MYLEDGFALAKRKGNKGAALGFVMTIFQKIAASSFAAVRRTLRRRLLMLDASRGAPARTGNSTSTRREQPSRRSARADPRGVRPRRDDSRGRESRSSASSPTSSVSLVKKLDEEELELASDPYGCEYGRDTAEEAAAAVVSLALARRAAAHSGTCWRRSPSSRETKVEKLLRGLGHALAAEPDGEGRHLRHLPRHRRPARARDRAGVSRPGRRRAAGGDHGAKLAAERRFRQKDGPKVLVCTAAGREGINLQFARILFNFDLPWNPMDIEQRIGRIHRYGQQHTAQVYNLVLSDTIEGRIFLLLDDKLKEIARALGKVDEHGNVAEDLRTQILGQLSERLNYDQLYQEALSDPELRRTRLELEAALANAAEARKVVFELFQDLEGFSLDDYKPFADVSAGLERLVRFLGKAAREIGGDLTRTRDTSYEFRWPGRDGVQRFTTERSVAVDGASVDLLGLDHSTVEEALRTGRNLSAEEIGAAVKGDSEESGVVTQWLIECQGEKGDRRTMVQSLAVRSDGLRMPAWERLAETFFDKEPVSARLSLHQRLRLLHEFLEPMLERELKHRGMVADGEMFRTTLIGWIEVVGTNG